MSSLVTSSAPRRAPGSAGFRRLAAALYGAGFVLLGWCGAVCVEAAAYQAFQSSRLDRLIRDLRSIAGPSGVGPQGAVATRAEAMSGGLVGRIEVERIGLSAIVAEGIDDRTLRRAVGHLPGTPFPGERGNAALSGHRDTFLRRLEDVREGDVIRITTLDGVFDYAVDSIRVVEPTQVDVLDSGRAPELTLITCYPFRYIGPAPERYIVRSRLIGSSHVSATAERPTRNPMRKERVHSS